MKKLKKLFFGVLIFLLIALISAITLFFVGLYVKSTYYVETYKPEQIALRGIQKELQSRFYDVNMNDYTLNIEWFTYDNKVINKPPYNLFLVIDPKNNKVNKVYIDKIKVSSTLDKQYKFDKELPRIIYKRTDGVLNRQSYKFSESFDFQFDSKEQIVLTFTIVTEYDDQTISKDFEIKFLPIKVKHYAPIV